MALPLSALGQLHLGQGELGNLIAPPLLDEGLGPLGLIIHDQGIGQQGP